ncbi:MAG: lytic transglycosylase domain-containing protein [Sandaracinaceae bacterium]
MTARPVRKIIVVAMLRTLPALGLLAAVALVPGGQARADIYTYTDEDGVVHFSNRRPEGRRGVRRIRTRPSRPARPRGPRPPSTPAPQPDRYHRYDAYIQEAAALYQLPEALLRAVIKVESDYHERAVSHAGACGLMQLMPRTAARMGVRDIFEPRQNILGGARYLRVLANTFGGDLVLTVAGYNAGEGAVVRHRGVPPFDETQRYVRRVLSWYYGFLDGRPPAGPR